MKDDSFLERLARRLPGQTLDDILVEQAVEQAEPLVGDALIVAAIPLNFDGAILGVLLGQPDRGAELARTLCQEHSFITSFQGRYTFDETTRRAILQKLLRDDAAWFRRLNSAAAHYFQDQAAQAGPAERDDPARDTMYHLLASDEGEQARGYAMLLEMFEQAEQNYRPGTAFILIRLASEQRDLLTPERRVGLDWLMGRLHRLQGHPAKAIGVLRHALDANPAGEMRGQIELALAGALGDSQQWADGILSARSAHQLFRTAHAPLDEARALTELARAYAGLARRVRGTRAVRPRIQNAFLNFFYQIGVFLERLPILLYLMTQLGARRLLPVLGRVARDQDWVVARLFGTAAASLRRAEALLQSQSSAANPRSAAEQLRIEAHRTLAWLYRTLGHLAYANTLLEDLLEHPLVLENEYRMSRIRLDLADTLLDAGRAELAAEELRATLPVFQSAKDVASEARARYVMGQAVIQACATGLAAHQERLTAGVRELERSLDLQIQLGNLEAQVEVARALDQVAADDRVPTHHEARVRAGQAAARVPERRFPVRYEHPRILQFRTAAIISLTLAFLIIGFFSVRTQVGTEVGAAALIESSALTAPSNEMTPSVTVDLPEQQIRPRFQGGFALGTTLIVLTAYMLLYLVIGVGLISIASLETLREAESHYLALDAQGIRYCQSDGATERALAWGAIEEGVKINRGVYERPIASYSHLALFGVGAALDIPGRTVTYETRLISRITTQLSVRLHSMGFSILKSWPGVLFAVTLTLHLWFIVLSGITADLAILHVIGPYSSSDLFAFSYIGLLAPLGGWLVINPLRETLTLKPASRWPLWLGGVGLVLEIILLVASPGALSALPHPNIYPVLIGAFLIVATAVFISFARRWEGRPSNRTTHVYPAPARLGAVLVAAVALVLALNYGQHEVRAYHAMVMGNDMRDRANRTGDTAVAKQAIERYTEAITLTPYNAAAYVNRGAVRATTGDYEQAIQDYDRALQLGPRQAIVHANRALAYQGLAHSLKPQVDRQVAAVTKVTDPPEVKQNLEKALDDYKVAQALKPQETSYLIHTGVILHELGRYAEATQVFSRTLQLEPDDADAYAGRAWATFQTAAQDLKDQPSEATKYYLRAWSDFQHADELLAGSSRRSDVSRQRANVLNGQAWIAYKFRQYDSAAEFFAVASHLEPNNPAYHISLGNIYWLIFSGTSQSADRNRKLIEDALAEYEKAIALTDKASAKAYLYRTKGQFHYLLRNQSGHDLIQELTQGVAADDAAIALDNTVLEYYLRRGQIGRLLAENLRPVDWTAAALRYNTAISDLTHVIQSGAPNTSQVNEARSALVVAYSQLGWGYHLNSDHTQAISVTLQAIEVDPKYAIARFNLAVIRLYMNDIQQARLDYKDAISVTCKINVSDANTAYAYAKDDLGAFKKTLKPDQAELNTIADEMVALINDPRCSR